MKGTRAPWGFLAPYGAIFAMFWAWPIAFSFYVSFLDTRGWPWVWRPSQNWSRLLGDPLFHKALWNTLFILVAQVPLMLALATALAVALDAPSLRLKGLFRFAFFAPVVVGAVAYSAVFRLMLNTDFGVVNAALRGIGLPGVDWLNSPIPAMAAIIAALTWRWTGYNAVILMAGLQGIPPELYEAARIDGASTWQQFRFVTLAGLRPMLVFCAVLSIIGTLQLFTEPFLITGGGPGNATTTLGVYLYQQGFRNFNFGYASTVAYAVAALSAAFSLLGRRWFGGEE